jgi:uncharacterized protein
MKYAAAVALFVLSIMTHAGESQPPIIDMHLHALSIESFVTLAGPPPIPHCIPMTDYLIPQNGQDWSSIVHSRKLSCRAAWSPMTDDEVMQETVAILKRRNVFGVTSGAHVVRYKQAAPDRIIQALSFGGGPDAPSVDAVRQSLTGGEFLVFGEVTAQYGGLSPDDPALEPYWSLAEELNIPVGIHIGTGPVGAPYLAFKRYRARLHSPLGLEEVLLRHPKLRVYIMHAGWPMLDDLLAVLWTHPQVYVDLGVIDWALPTKEFHRYLQRIVEAGFGKRVLFGSDQMIWPEVIEVAIESIESAKFLSEEQKRDIFFNNAVRFLQLPQHQLEAIHGRSDVESVH